MSNANSLPFELSEDSVATWLESISSISTVNAGSQLNKAINQIRKVDGDLELIFPILIKLTPTTLHLSNALYSTVANAPNNKSKDITAKIAKLSMQLFRNLSLAFHSLINAETLEMEQKQQAAYYALQMTGQYLRVSNAFKEMPSETLWNMSGELYAFAANNNCLEENISIKIPEFKIQSTIEAVLKRNLLFTICAFHKSSDVDNQEMYLFANDNFDFLKLDSEQKKTNYFSWNFKGGIPIQVTQANRPLVHNNITLDTTDLVELTQSNSFYTKLSQSETDRLFRHLSGYQKLIIENIPSAPIIFNMLSGLQAISDFLNKREKLIKIHKLSSELTDEMPDYTMSLQPLDHKQSFSSKTTNEMLKKPSPGNLKMGLPVKCIRTTDDNFLIAETQNTDFFCGDLVILINNSNAVMPGIIRQQKSVGPADNYRFLIEKFQGQLAAYTINPEKQSGETVIVIDETGDHPQVLLATERYHNGSTITFNNKTARLVSLVEYSPLFVRYQISFV